MKTAMQELIEWMIEESEVIPFDQQRCYDKAEELLEKEKKQILDAMRYALDEDGHNGSWIFNFIESYYKNMYED